MQKSCSPYLLILASVALPLTALCDTFILKGGEKLEGRIVHETPEAYELEVRVSPTILDNRTIQKSEVEKVEKTAAHQAAYEAIKHLKPGPNSLPAASYPPITAALQKFASEHPQSPQAGEVAAQLAAFTEEKRRVDAGEVKLDEQWLSKEEVQKERYQIAGRLLFQRMQEAGNRKDIVGALNAFEQMNQNFPGAQVYPDAAEYALQLAMTLKRTTNMAAQKLKLSKAQEERGMQLMSPQQRSEAQARAEVERRQGDAAVDAADKAQVRWPPFLPRSERALDILGQRAGDEISRLQNTPTTEMRKGARLAERGREALASKQIEEAKKLFSDALQAWNGCELAQRLDKEANEMAAGMTTAATAAPETPLPAPTPPVAVKEATPPAEKTEEAPAEESAPAEAEKEGPNFFVYAVGGLLAAILLLAGVNVFKKIRAQRNEITE